MNIIFYNENSIWFSKRGQSISVKIGVEEWRYTETRISNIICNNLMQNSLILNDDKSKEVKYYLIEELPLSPGWWSFIYK